MAVRGSGGAQASPRRRRRRAAFVPSERVSGARRVPVARRAPVPRQSSADQRRGQSGRRARGTGVGRAVAGVGAPGVGSQISAAGRRGRAVRPAGPVSRRSVGPAVRATQRAVAPLVRLDQEVQRAQRTARIANKVVRARNVEEIGGLRGLLSRVTTGRDTRLRDKGLARRSGLPGATLTLGTAVPTVGGGSPARQVRAVGTAVADDPGGVYRGSKKQLRDTLAGIPSAATAVVADVVEDALPDKTIRQARDDYKRRYGGTDKELVDRITKEGAFAEAVDLVGAAAAGGATAGRVLAGTVRRSAPQSRLARTVSEPRAKLRTSGGEAKGQRLSPSLFGAVAQKRLDVARARKSEREVNRRPRGQSEAQRRLPVPVRVEVREAVDRTRGAAGRQRVPGPSTRRAVRGEDLPRGAEVVPLRRRKIGRAQTANVAGRKGRGRLSQIAEQGVELGSKRGGAKRDLSSLDKREVEAFKYAQQLGITGPENARGALAAHIDLVKRSRKAEGTEVLDTDELPLLERMAADPGAYFTPRLAEVSKGERARAERLAVGDPDISQERARLRVAKPQAETLGVVRGGTPIRVAETKARRAARTAKAQRRRAGRKVESTQRKAGREKGRTTLLVEQQASRDVVTAREYDRQAAALGTQAAELRKASRVNMLGKRRANPLSDVGPLTKAQRRYRTKARQLGKARQEPKLGSDRYNRGKKQARRADELVARARALRDEAETIRSPTIGGRRPARNVTRRVPLDTATRKSIARNRRKGEATGDRGIQMAAQLLSQAHQARAVLADRLAAMERRFDQLEQRHRDAAARGERDQADAVAREAQSLTAEHQLAVQQLDALDGHVAAVSRGHDEKLAALRQRKGTEGTPASRRVTVHEEPARTRPAIERLTRAQDAAAKAERAREVARERVKEAKASERDIRARRRRGDELGPDAEPTGEFIARADRMAGVRHGLERPGFYPSRKREEVKFAQRTIGGAKAVQSDKKYTGALYRTGREDNSVTTYLQALAQNIKRKYNWNHVADTFDAHTFDWGRNLTIDQIKNELVRRGIDPRSVAFWNPGRLRRERADRDEQEGELEEGTGRGEEPGEAGLYDALLRSSAKDTDSARKMSSDPDDFEITQRWSVIPRAVYDEIHADTRPSGFFGRSLDIIKGKQARILLGLSPLWLQYQIAANGLLTGLAGTGPLDLIKANLIWWRQLTPEQKREIEPYIGVGAFHEGLDQTHIGAASDNRLVNAYRAFKANEFWHKPRKGLRGGTVRALNPLDVLFRIDNAQNRTFRRAILYSQIKRDAYRRMGGRITAIQREQDGLLGPLSAGPVEMMNKIIEDPGSLERHAQYVNDFLGDYLTYTARERRVLSRNVMFYGFLRFSLRFTFYTMPVKHPVRTAVIGQLARMQTEEVRKLLGGDDLPFALGRFFYNDDGKLKSIDVTRANPALNTLVNTKVSSATSALRSAVGLAPPLFVSLANQVYAASSFKGRPFRVENENQGRRPEEYSDKVSARVFLEEMLSLAAPYRGVKKATSTAPEGDDSSAVDDILDAAGLPRVGLDRRPTVYVDPKIVAGLKHDEDRRPVGLPRRLRQEFFLGPKLDFSPDISEALRLRKREQQRRRATRRQKVEALTSGGGRAPALDYSKATGGGGGGTGTPAGRGDAPPRLDYSKARGG